MQNTNPLLTNNLLPEFSKIKPKHILPAINFLLADNRAKLKKILLNKNNFFTWENLILPLDEMNNRLEFVWSTITHLNGVKNSPELRKIYDKALPLVTQYYSELGQNFALYQATLSLTKNATYKKLNFAQQKAISNELRDFYLSGVSLSNKDKKKFLQLQQKISALANKFSNNVLDATEQWEYSANKNEIQGIPEYALAVAKSLATEKKLNGWLFTLDFPSYLAVITFASNANLRQTIYTAYFTRASELTKNARKLDNSKIMVAILTLKKQMAAMLGFKNYAEYSLVSKMAKTPREVMNFLNNLAKYSLKKAKNDYAELTKFALKQYGCKKLEPWDIAYYSEKLRQAKYTLSDDEVRPYFAVEQVINGLFTIAKKVFKLKFREIKNFSSWHKDVRLFAIYDEKNQLRGNFFIDLFARKGKRSGAWMSHCRNRLQLSNGSIQFPVAFLTCNFTQPCKNEPSLLTHAEIDTLFHEFGHCLQHILTQINYARVSGINGVPTDAVELPSQLMENFCWNSKSLKYLSSHFKTHKKLPNSLIAKILQAKNFQSGLLMLRQLEFALLDFRIHMEFNPKKKYQIQQIIDQVRKKISVVPVAKFNRLQHSFKHIFCYGYAAGYYSYKWAEVLAADAFAKFAANGTLNSKIGMQFRREILEVGGAIDPLDAFINFRKAKPNIKFLLKNSGIL